MKKLILITTLLFTALLCFVVTNTLSAKTTLNVNFTHDGLTINARLQLPNGTGPFPVIIINPRSGKQDRDGMIHLQGGTTPCLYPNLVGDTLTPYLGLSEALSDSGYAVLTFDKVEFTYSNWGDTTFNKLWLTLKSGIQYLKTRSDIDANEMVLIGHVEGATFIPYIARTESSIKALISLSGPRMPYDTLLAFQEYIRAKLCPPFDTNTAKILGATYTAYFNDIRTGNWTSATPDFNNVPAATWNDYIKVADSVAINYNLANRPTLFVGLGDDFNVPVSTELVRFQNETTINADFYTLPGINHFLTTATDTAVSQVLTDTIVYWLRQQGVSVPSVTSRDKDAFNFAVSGKSLSITAAGEQIERVMVYDISGRKHMDEAVNGKAYNIDLNRFIPNMYFIRVNGKQHTQVYKLTTL